MCGAHFLRWSRINCFNRFRKLRLSDILLAVWTVTRALCHFAMTGRAADHFCRFFHDRSHRRLDNTITELIGTDDDVHEVTFDSVHDALKSRAAFRCHSRMNTIAHADMIFAQLRLCNLLTRLVDLHNFAAFVFHGDCCGRIFPSRFLRRQFHFVFREIKHLPEHFSIGSVPVSTMLMTGTRIPDSHDSEGVHGFQQWQAKCFGVDAKLCGFFDLHMPSHCCVKIASHAVILTRHALFETVVVARDRERPLLAR